MTAKKRRIWQVAAIVGAFLVTAGAAAFGGWYAGKSSNSANSESPKKTTSSKTTKPEAETPDGDNAGTENPGAVKVTVYFSDSQVIKLVGETREVSAASPGKAALDELQKGPAEAGHGKTIPEGLTAKSVTVEGNTAVVEYGQVFNALYPKGSTGEKMFVYSIVNTLTGIDGITAVVFKVDGSPPSVSGSNYDLAGSFTRHADLIAE